MTSKGEPSSAESKTKRGNEICFEADKVDLGPFLKLFT